MKVLYVIPRTDLDTMGRGRMAAQVSHATSDLYFKFVIKPLWDGKVPDPDITEWMNECPESGCGTVLVLDGGSINNINFLLKELSGTTIKHGLFVDPEYFVPDGISGHIVKDVPTCLWLFGEKEIISKWVTRYNLLSNDPIPK